MTPRHTCDPRRHSAQRASCDPRACNLARSVQERATVSSAGLGTLAALALTLGFAAGCWSPNVYSTARTVPAGESRGFGGVEVHNADYATAPAIFGGTRIGLAERLDFGVRVGVAIQADLKLTALLHEDAALAIAIGGWSTWLTFLSPPPSAGSDARLIFDLRVGDGAYLVLHAGAGYATFAQLLPNEESDLTRQPNLHGPTATMGLGASFRLSDIIIRPEISVAAIFIQDRSPAYWPTGGIAFERVF